MEAWEPVAKKRTQGFEGLRLIPYRDTKGFWTIGFGHFLPQLGPIPRSITREQAESMFDDDWAVAKAGARRLVKGFDGLSDNRKAAFVDLCFNMGEFKFATFHKTLKAANAGNWVACGANLVDSAYAHDVGERAFLNARMLVEG